MDASANELGLYTPIGSVISGVQDAMYPAPESLIRRIRSEVDPDFIPLWVNKWFRSPNGGTVKTGYHLIARYVRHPHHRAPVIKNLILPTTKEYGIRYENPILAALSMDGLTNEERNAGKLPQYEPFTEETLRRMKKAMWKRNNKHSDEEVDEVEDAVKSAESKVWKNVNDEATYRHHNDRLQFGKGTGAIDHVYVSSTLVKLREAAGIGDAA